MTILYRIMVNDLIANGAASLHNLVEQRRRMAGISRFLENMDAAVIMKIITDASCLVVAAMSTLIITLLIVIYSTGFY